MDGWVKLWRKSLGSGLLQNHQLWAFWCWCLMKASHRPTRQMVGWQMVELQPGQFVFGRQKAARELGLSERTIRTCLKKLQTMENLTIRATNKFSVITIVNWESYQGHDQQGDQQSDQHATSKRPAGDQHVTTNKNGRMEEWKEGEEEESAPPSLSWDFQASTNGVPVKDIAEAWNKTLEQSSSPLPRLVKISEGSSRYKLVRARWKEHPSLNTWLDLFSRVARSSFLNGNNQRGWSASFDWVVKKDNFLKALEGNYDDKEHHGKRALF